MARYLHMSWDNRNECRIGKRKTYNGWTKRVRWYQNNDGTDIRLQFQDTDGIQNKFYTNANDVRRDLDAFKSGELTTQNMRS